jgi:hypothetical protein
LTYSLNVAMQEDDSVAFPIEAEKFSPEKSVKDRAYLPQALVIVARLDKTPHPVEDHGPRWQLQSLSTWRPAFYGDALSCPQTLQQVVSYLPAHNIQQPIS